MATEPSRLNLLFQHHGRKFMTAMSVGYIAFAIFVHYIGSPVMFKIIQPVLAVSTTCGVLFHNASIKLRSNKISIGIFFYYPALFYHTVFESFATAWIITVLLFVAFIDGSKGYVWNRIMDKMATYVEDKCSEYYKKAVVNYDDDMATKRIVRLLKENMVTLLFNGVCLAIIIMACQAARNKREKCSRLPLNDDVDAPDANTTIEKTKKSRWGPETTRVYYCFVVVLTLSFVKLYLRE